MKYALSFIVAIGLAFGTVVLQAQSSTQITSSTFEEALKLYENNSYHEAIPLFEQTEGSVSKLFLAKSYYAVGLYRKAIETATPLSTQPPVSIVNEAQFVRALSHFQLKEFNRSLELLNHLGENAISDEVRSEATKLQNSIIEYLSYNQRVSALRNIRNPQMREELVLSHTNKYTTVQARELLQILSQSNSGVNYSSKISEIERRPIFFEGPPSFKDAPHGTIYRVGVLLPSFENDSDDKTVSSGLYNGILLAVDAFNRGNLHKKVILYYADSQAGRSVASQATYLIEEKGVDAIIGPLFSEEVSAVAKVAESYKIPVLAPLANTISFDERSNYIYQINPSFESRGRKIARFLVEELNMYRFGVIVESGTLGAVEARAFKQEAESLGAEVPLFFEENFASRGYYLGDILPWFTNNPALITDTTKYVADSLEAVYLPFTGDAAPTLLDLALTGLQAFSPDYPIISNEELNYLTHSSQRVRFLKMIYADTFFLSEGSEEATNFRFDYRNRTGYAPNTFSYIGYDIASFYLDLLEQFKNPDSVRDYLEFAPQFDGIATSILFGNTNINQSLQFFRIGSQESRIVNPQDFRLPDRIWPDSSDSTRIELFDNRENHR
jgi:ABC-type branched-subunit amino acid transport system substrate-binding protein